MTERVSKPWWRRWSLLVPAGVLFLAAGLQGLTLLREVPATRDSQLGRSLPASLPGWRVRELPLGPNEAVNEAVTKRLNFDDVVYREYSRPGVSFSVYAAYWNAGKMPTQLVFSHTPDRCWTENGWTCQAMRFREPVKVGGRALQPAEWRRFLPPDGGKPVYVRYWHLVDGKVYTQGTRFNAVPNPWYWWLGVVNQALRGCREQYFIRLSANVPFENVWDDPTLAPVLCGLESMGLSAGRDPTSTP